MAGALPTTDMAYAVHTRTCTYLLDDGGVCRLVVSPQGVIPSHIRQCIGAQFVACLDLRVKGGLTGELVPGAMALFVRQLDDRMVMLRTGEIQHVDDNQRKPVEPVHEVVPPPRMVLQDQPIEAYGRRSGTGWPAPPPSLGVVRYQGEEQTITLTIPHVKTRPPGDDR